MRILNFNIRFGGGKRTQEILDYILNNDFDLIVLTEFVNNDKGQIIIDNLDDKGYTTQSSNEDTNLGCFIACKEDFVTNNVEDRWADVYIPKMDLNVLGVLFQSVGELKRIYFGKKF